LQSGVHVIISECVILCWFTVCLSIELCLSQLADLLESYSMLCNESKLLSM
jgi:hypothetical protein